MNKHVSKLLQPGVFWYCLILLAFAVAAALLDQYYLAAGELVVTVIAMVVSRLLFIRRRNALMQYVQSATDAEGISVHAGSPFPMAVIRLPEGEIIWGNEGFYAITGLSDGCRYQTLESVVPGFTTGWLREGRNELPGDQLIGTRRYRIYGNYVRSEDDATTVRLATIFFADMTEMFNVRDEFLRTRPITAVILIDNYDELMSNLPDSTISKLDAQINEAVSGWVTGLHALCRKMERNRYLLLFDQKLLFCQLFFCSGKARFDFFLIRFFHCFPFLKHKKSPFSYTFSSSIHISAITFRRYTDLCLLLCCHSSFSFSQNFRNIKAFSHFLYFFQNLTVLFFCLYFRILVFFYKRFL